MAMLLSGLMAAKAQTAAPLVSIDYQTFANETVTGSVYGKTGSHLFVCGNIEVPPVSQGGTTGNTNSYVSKLDSAGNIVWTTLNGTQSSGANFYINGMATDTADNIYVTGYYSGALSYGSYSLPAYNAGSNFFIAKLNSAGTVQWLNNASTTSGNSVTGADVAVDAAGNVYALGAMSNTASFGNFSLTAPSGNRMNFLVKYSPGGTALWANSFSPYTNGSGTAFTNIAATKGNLNRIYLAGQFSGSYTVGSTTLTSNGATKLDVMLAKLDTAGNVMAVTSLGGSNDDRLNDMVVGPTNKIAITGYYLTGTTLNGTTYTASSSYTQGYTAVLDTGFNYSWVTTYGSSTGNTILWANQLDAGDNCYITGEMRGGLTFGTTSLSITGYSNAFIAKFGPTGTVLFADNAGSNSTGSPLAYSIGQSIAVSPTGNRLFVTGKYVREMHAGTSTNTITSAYNNRLDMFVLKYYQAALSGCTGTPAVATVTGAPASAVCSGVASLLTATGQSSGQGIVTYWQSRPAGGTGSFVTINGATAATYSAAPTVSTEYRFVDSCTGSGQKSVSNSVTINVQPKPLVASIGYTNNGASYTFNANGVQNAGTYTWTFGDGSPASTQASPVHAYAATGSYDVKLIVQNACGKDSSTVKIQVAMGVSGTTRNEALHIVPNPASESLMVMVPADMQVQKLRLMNTTGQVVAVREVKPGSISTLAVSQAPAGMYLLQVVTDQGMVGRLVEVRH
jgi:PKD repeat protein